VPYLACLLLCSLVPPLFHHHRDEVCPVSTRDFALPINYDPARRQQIERLELFVSTDRGKNWKKTDCATPDQDRFVFSAPKDGIYWFVVQVLGKDGTKEPADLRTTRFVRKVLVDTNEKKQAGDSPPETRTALKPGTK
jgi:hypothetical protein